jgi:hypothetical protein
MQVVDAALPAPLLQHLQHVFRPGADFWREHNYGRVGYFSYFFPMVREDRHKSYRQTLTWCPVPQHTLLHHVGLGWSRPTQLSICQDQHNCRSIGSSSGVGCFCLHAAPWPSQANMLQSFTFSCGLLLWCRTLLAGSSRQPQHDQHAPAGCLPAGSGRAVLS